MHIGIFMRGKAVHAVKHGSRLCAGRHCQINQWLAVNLLEMPGNCARMALTSNARSSHGLRIGKLRGDFLRQRTIHQPAPHHQYAPILAQKSGNQQMPRTGFIKPRARKRTKRLCPIHRLPSHARKRHHQRKSPAPAWRPSPPRPTTSGACLHLRIHMLRIGAHNHLALKHAARGASSTL